MFFPFREKPFNLNGDRLDWVIFLGHAQRQFDEKWYIKSTNTNLPERVLKDLNDTQRKIFLVHYEALKSVNRLIKREREKGFKALLDELKVCW